MREKNGMKEDRLASPNFAEQQRSYGPLHKPMRRFRCRAAINDKLRELKPRDLRDTIGGLLHVEDCSRSL